MLELKVKGSFLRKIEDLIGYAEITYLFQKFQKLNYVDEIRSQELSVSCLPKEFGINRIVQPIYYFIGNAARGSVRFFIFPGFHEG